MASRFDQFCILSSEARESEFVLARPDGAAARVVVDNIVGNETANLGIVVHFSGFVEVVFRPGAAVGHDQGWRVEDTGTGPKLDDVVEERRDGRLCSLPLRPSIAWVKSSFMSRPPSVVGITPSFLQAMTIHWRCLRLPTR